MRSQHKAHVNAVAATLRYIIEQSWECGKLYAGLLAEALKVTDTTESDAPFVCSQKITCRSIDEFFSSINCPSSVFYHGKTMSLICVNGNGDAISIGSNHLRRNHQLFHVSLERVKNAKSC